MGTPRLLPPGGKARPSAPLPAQGVRWWKAPDYECLGEGLERAIIPIGNPKAVHHDPGAIDWRSLMDWSTLQLRDVTDRHAEDMCAWFTQHGAVGYFIGNVSHIEFPLTEVIATYPGHRRAAPRARGRGRPGPPRVFTRDEWACTSYHRVGGDWFSEQEEGDLAEQGYAFGGRLTMAPDVADLFLQYDPVRYDKEGLLSPSLHDLAARYSVPLSEFRAPDTPDFWALYKEPIADVLNAARLLRQLAVPRGTRRTKGLYQLLQGTGWGIDDDDFPEVHIASLVHAYAYDQVMRTHDVVSCARKNCTRPFLKRTLSHRYCSQRCENTANKAERRKKRVRHSQRKTG